MSKAGRHSHTSATKDIEVLSKEQLYEKYGVSEDDEGLISDPVTEGYFTKYSDWARAYDQAGDQYDMQNINVKTQKTKFKGVADY